MSFQFIRNHSNSIVYKKLYNVNQKIYQIINRYIQRRISVYFADIQKYSATNTNTYKIDNNNSNIQNILKIKSDIYMRRSYSVVVLNQRNNQYQQYNNNTQHTHLTNKNIYKKKLQEQLIMIKHKIFNIQCLFNSQLITINQRQRMRKHLQKQIKLKEQSQFAVDGRNNNKDNRKRNYSVDMHIVMRTSKRIVNRR